MTKSKHEANVSSTTSTALQPALEAILERYVHAKTSEQFGKNNPLWSEFERAGTALRNSNVVNSFPHLVVRWSSGQGRWATIPWIAALDARETKKTSEGVYVVYLFCADMSGVCLTLSQGTSWIMTGYREKGRLQLRRRAAKLRLRSSALSAHGFEVNDKIDLKSSIPLVLGYQDSTVAYKRYSRAHVPDDASLLRDLGAALTVYDSLVPSRSILGLAGDEEE